MRVSPDGSDSRRRRRYPAPTPPVEEALIRGRTIFGEHEPRRSRELGSREVRYGCTLFRQRHLQRRVLIHHSARSTCQTSRLSADPEAPLSVQVGRERLSGSGRADLAGSPGARVNWRIVVELVGERLSRCHPEPRGRWKHFRPDPCLRKPRTSRFQRGNRPLAVSTAQSTFQAPTDRHRVLPGEVVQADGIRRLHPRARRA